MASEFRGRIATSLIASFIFLYLLNPILASVGRIIRIGSSHAYTAYLDSLYGQMAAGVDAKLPLVILALPVAVIIAVAISSFAIVLATLRRHQRVNVTNDKDQETSVEDIPRDDHGSRRRASAVTMLLAATAVCVVANLNLWSYWYCLKQTTSFRQHLAIVAPCLSDRDRLELQSSWASMQSERDYQLLSAKLNAAASQCGKVLPENSLFSFTFIL